MRQLTSLLCFGLAFTTVLSGHSDSDHDNHEEHEHDHDHDFPSTLKYPVIIPNTRSSKIHSAEVTEIGDPPSATSYPQWSGPPRNDKVGNDIDPDYQYPPYKSYPEQKEQYSERDKDHKIKPGYLLGLPPFQKYGYPPKCVDSYPKSDITIQQTQCLYMVVITLHAEFKKNDPKSMDYAHFKISRRMDKKYGYVAVGLSTDDKMEDDHIVECVKIRSSVHPMMFHSWSNNHNRPSRLRDNSDIIKNKTENFDTQSNILSCEFDRPMITRVEYSKGDGPLRTKVFDLTKEKYKIFMAVGETAKPDSDILGQHGRHQDGAVAIFEPNYYTNSAPSYNQGFLAMFVTVVLGYVIL